MTATDTIKNVFSRPDADEAERKPDDGGTPRPDDMSASVTDAADANFHAEAAANTVTDEEAGASSSNGGVEPIVDVQALGENRSKRTAEN